MSVEKLDLGSLPRWEKITWVLILVYLIIVFYVFWIYGLSRLPFPL